MKSCGANEPETPSVIPPTNACTASIRGSLLKFDEEDTNQGVFFIAADGTETRVTDFVKNKPSELMFFVPDSLTSGSFQLEIRTIFHNSKKIRKGKLSNNIVPAS